MPSAAKFDDFALRLRDPTMSPSPTPPRRRPLSQRLHLWSPTESPLATKSPSQFPKATPSSNTARSSAMPAALSPRPARPHPQRHHALTPTTAANPQMLHRLPPDCPYPPQQMKYFRAMRPDGRVGTRNYIGVISSVNCPPPYNDTSRTVSTPRLRPRFPRRRRRPVHPQRRRLQLGHPHEVMSASSPAAPNIPTSSATSHRPGLRNQPGLLIRSDYRLDVIKPNEERPTFINIRCRRRRQNRRRRGRRHPPTPARANEAAARSNPSAISPSPSTAAARMAIRHHHNPALGVA